MRKEPRLVDSGKFWVFGGQRRNSISYICGIWVCICGAVLAYHDATKVFCFDLVVISKVWKAYGNNIYSVWNPYKYIMPL